MLVVVQLHSKHITIIRKIIDCVKNCSRHRHRDAVNLVYLKLKLKVSHLFYFIFIFHGSAFLSDFILVIYLIFVQILFLISSVFIWKWITCEILVKDSTMKKRFILVQLKTYFTVFLCFIVNNILLYIYLLVNLIYFEFSKIMVECIISCYL